MNTLYPATEVDYEPLEPLGSDRLRVRFRGPYEGRLVTWDATLLTLARLAREQPRSQWRNFIDIGAESADGIRLTVGLKVVRFDAATVAKTITMIRQYKRLRPGRHEYGPPFRPPTEP